MRYELYKYNEKLEWYDFVLENDNIDNLYNFVLYLGIIESKKIKDVDKWIFIDNEPNEYNLLNLGYHKQIPNNEVVRERIKNCKFSKYFNNKDIFKGKEIDFTIFNEEYEKAMKIAEEETNKICSLLFSFEPNFRLPFND